MINFTFSMRKKNLKFKNINIDFANAMQSRFVVNLKKDLEKENKKDNKLELKNIIKEKVVKIFQQAKIILLNINKKHREKNTSINFHIFKNQQKKINAECRVFKEQDKRNFSFLKNSILLKNNLIDQLAFVCLIKCVLKLVKNFIFLTYKICFCVGWTTSFLIKYCFFIIIVLLKIIIKPFELLIFFIGKISFYSIIKLGKINYVILMIFIKSSKIVNQRICSKAIITNKILKQKKDCFYQNIKLDIKYYYNIFKTIFSKRIFIRDFLPRPNLIYLKPVGLFALTLLILILPVKAFTYYKSIDNVRGQVLDVSKNALGQFLSAGESVADFNFDQAQENFSKASDDFLSAQAKLGEINNLLLSLTAFAPDENLRLAAVSKRILRAGELSAELGKNLSLIIEKSLNSKDKGLKEILDNFRLNGNLAANQASEINNLLSGINENDLPGQYRQQFISLKEKTVILSNSLAGLVGSIDKLDNFFGVASDKRYLLVFQNNTELRASGGFIGSFALLDFSKGKLKNIEAPGGGSYDVKAGMLNKIIAPQPLQLVAPQWQFWDANWWADWSTSAKKLKWFYEKSDGPTVDGVISFTPTVIEELLKIIGPIDLTEQYGVIINADNFWLKTQELAERKANITNQPKKIISDLMDKIIVELPDRITKDNLIPLLKIADQLFSNKQILFYFVDPELQNKVVELGWDGGFKKTSGDYLAVINTNIAGGKSDRKIKETINHQVEIMSDKTIIDTVKIIRTHTGIKREPFSGVRNVDWMRIYVPQGSTLISAQGFNPVNEIYFKKPDSAWQADPDISLVENNTEMDSVSGTKIYQELDKTVFANWSQVDPGQSVEIILKYKLPFTIDKITELVDQSMTDKIINKTLSLVNPEQKQLYPYSLLIQKQPGAGVDQLTTNLIINNNFSPVWKYPKGLSVNQTGWQISDNLDSDKFWATLLEVK